MPSCKVSVLLDLLQENESCTLNTPLDNTALSLFLKPIHSFFISSSVTGQGCGGSGDYKGNIIMEVRIDLECAARQLQGTMHTLTHSFTPKTSLA